jgi:hypothetical protein
MSQNSPTIIDLENSSTIIDFEKAPTITNLFELVKKYGYIVRKNPAINGLKAWKPVKELLDDMQQLGSGWKINIKINDKIESNIDLIFNYVRDTLKMYGDDNDEKEKKITSQEWQKNHFMLQLIRIPRNTIIEEKNCTLRRLCQVAYNIGQFMAEHEKSPYSTVVMEYFEGNNLSQISSYISDETISSIIIDPLIIEQIEEMIEQIKKMIDLSESSITEPPKSLNGGNINEHHKILKYKTKLLNESQNSPKYGLYLAKLNYYYTKI